MTSDPIEIVIDTSVVRELRSSGPRALAIHSLFALARAGMVELVAWSRIADDLPEIADYPIKLVSSNPTELGIDVTRADPAVIRETVLGDQPFESRFGDLQMLASGRTKSDWRNWDHLHFHLVNGRRHYVTLDAGILAVAVEVGEWFGVKVMTVEEAIEKSGHSELVGELM